MDTTSIFKSNYFQLRLYVVLSVILFLIIGYFTFTNMMKYLDIQNDIQTNINIYSSLEDADKRLTDELASAQESNKDLSQQIQTELDLVFPESQSHTSLTRALDNFANETHKLRDPFIINNLQYLAPETPEGANYSILPFKMTIQSSFTNFFKFLEYVDNSGVLADKTRLIDIQSIVINFVSPKGAVNNTSGRDEINFNVTMNAYFRKLNK